MRCSALRWPMTGSIAARRRISRLTSSRTTDQPIGLGLFREKLFGTAAESLLWSQQNVTHPPCKPGIGWLGAFKKSQPNLVLIKVTLSEFRKSLNHSKSLSSA